MLKISICICLLIIASVSAAAKAWRGIVPLHSSKHDVERLLGPPRSQGKYVSTYEFEGEVVDVYFASGPPCGSGLIDSWNVPRGTVVGIRITTRSVLPFHAVVSDPDRYIKSVDPKDARRVYYFDEEQGVRYTVRVDDESSQDVINVDYLPSRKDDRLKCSSPVSKAPSFSAPPFEQYGQVPIRHRNAILDNFAIELERDNKLKGYIFAQGSRRRSGDVRRVARGARDYLVNVRKVSVDRIVTMTSFGCDELTVELYLLPKDAPAPRTTGVAK